MKQRRLHQSQLQFQHLKSYSKYNLRVVMSSIHIDLVYVHSSLQNNFRIKFSNYTLFTKMSLKKCECCTRIKELEYMITNLGRQIDQLKGKNCKRYPQYQSQILAETLLLDASINDPKITLNSIADNIGRMNTKIAVLESKCFALPNIKESIYKQTAIIYYLQKKINELTSVDTPYTFQSSVSEENSKIKNKVYSQIKPPSSPGRLKQNKESCKEIDLYLD